MKKTLRRSAAKAPRTSRAPARRTLKKTAAEMTADEVVHLEQISQRYEEAERAWARMTAPLDGDDPWGKVEEHILSNASQDQERRWKYFSK